MTVLMRRLAILLACLAMIAVPQFSRAQTDPDAVKTGAPSTETSSVEAPAPAPQQPAPQVSEEPSPYNPLDTYSFYLTALFIGFGLIVILLQLAAMRRIPSVTADEIARNCAITLVVVASVALLVSGYSSQQVAPAFGLFGTIIGYLLGKAGKKEDQDAARKP